jgi:hypothetical protein
MRTRVSRTALLIALAGTVAMVAAAPASARFVSGKQTVVDENAGTYAMTGSLVGDWAITGFEEIATDPVYRAKGTELFDGCLDRDRNGSCRGEPKGKMRFKFHYWARFAGDGSVELGTCAHRVKGGSGDFSRAAGFIQMVDTPTTDPPFYFQTHYTGWLGVHQKRGGRHARSAAAPRGSC